MKVTTEMYTKLFNELTDVKKELEVLIERIKTAQTETDEMSINIDHI